MTDKRKHPEQCVIVFQIVLEDGMQFCRRPGLLQARSKPSSRWLQGPLALPTRSLPPLSLLSMPLLPLPPRVFPPPLPNPCFRGSPLQERRDMRGTGQSRDGSQAWTQRRFRILHKLQLKNTSNYCYVNAAIQATLATTVLAS